MNPVYIHLRRKMCLRAGIPRPGASHGKIKDDVERVIKGPSRISFHVGICDPVYCPCDAGRRPGYSINVIAGRQGFPKFLEAAVLKVGRVRVTMYEIGKLAALLDDVDLAGRRPADLEYVCAFDPERWPQSLTDWYLNPRLKLTVGLGERTQRGHSRRCVLAWSVPAGITVAPLACGYYQLAILVDGSVGFVVPLELLQTPAVSANTEVPLLERTRGVKIIG